MPIVNNIMSAVVFAVGVARIAPVSFMPNLYGRHEWRTRMVLTPPKIGGVNPSTSLGTPSRDPEQRRRVRASGLCSLALLTP